MILFKASWEKSNNIGDWVHSEFIIANNFYEVQNELPRATKIEIIDEDIRFINL